MHPEPDRETIVSPVRLHPSARATLPAGLVPLSTTDNFLEVAAMFEFARRVVATLQRHGHAAYFAGGCVRDLLLGVAPSDYDVATNATPERVLSLFPRVLPVGMEFGVVRVVDPQGGSTVEVATFRSDGAYSDGRRPDSVTYGTAKDDALRRDFTINGMFMDPLHDDQVIDFVGGRADLDTRVLRAIGNPWDRFSEDKLRLLRAVRFAARFSMTLDPDTERAVRGMADRLGSVSPERIAQEFRKMLVHPSRAEALGMCRSLGLLRTILPDLPDPAYHPQAEWHALSVVKHLPDQASFEQTLAAIGEGVQPDRLVANLKRLRLSNDEIKRIVWLAEHRHSLDAARHLPKHRLKRILAHEHGFRLIQLERADAEARQDAVACDHLDWAAAYRLNPPDGPLDPPPLVTGHDLIALGIRPGPNFAEWLEMIRDRQLDGLLTERTQALDLARRLATREIMGTSS